MKLFVWDFHGVMEKGNDQAVLEISNIVLENRGLKKRFTVEDNRKYYGLKWYQYFEKLLPELTRKDHESLQEDCFNFANDHLEIRHMYIKPNDYILEVLSAINESGHDQILLSNTRPNDLLWFVNAVNLCEYFPESKIFGVNAHQTIRNKSDALKGYLIGKQFDDLVIIGDSMNDMKLKNIAGGKTYFYTHPHLPMKKVDADYLITDLREVLKEI